MPLKRPPNRRVIACTVCSSHERLRYEQSQLLCRTSPISSPQNIFAIAVMSSHTNPPNWLDWFSIALPVSIAIDLAIWGLLMLYYNPDQEVTEILPLRPSTDPVNATQVLPSPSPHPTHPFHPDAQRGRLAALQHMPAAHAYALQTGFDGSRHASLCLVHRPQVWGKMLLCGGPGRLVGFTLQASAAQWLRALPL